MALFIYFMASSDLSEKLSDLPISKYESEWLGFSSMAFLNDRIALSYSFLIPKLSDFIHIGKK